MSAGVYRLEHVRTGRFYIGSSMRLEARREQWFRWLSSGPWAGAPVSARLTEAAAGSGAADWIFVVVERHPEGVARGRVLRAELAHVARSVRDFPDLCLNTWAPGRYDRRKPRFEARRALKRPGV